ncbi:hypothetical protein [Phormidium sp. FACHB-1136]|uniref:hypothetical protein n=1 Tax=Phormidium sp. FACHB-1136 TaxID=2692848 RepID=UPI001689E444|nr:hypothetical protein [Phormidium sp. FACHB-1136]MBD2425375.1 hypothetical protein [Phormidium sp. FACHB-1136]
MKDPRPITEIGFSLQLLNLGIPLNEADQAAQILYQDAFGPRTAEQQALIYQVWQKLREMNP